MSEIVSPYIYRQPITLLGAELTRVPEIISPQGELNRDFYLFFNQLVACFQTLDVKSLYQLSDRYLEESEFISMFNSTLRDHLANWVKCAEQGKGFDMQLDLMSLQMPSSSLYITLNMMTSMIIREEDAISTYLETKLSKLYITYKEDQFKLMSVFSPFTKLESK